MKKSLRNIVGGLGLLAMIGCVTPQGRQFSNQMGYTAVGTFIQEGIKKEMGAYERDRVEVNVNQGATYNSEERRILEQVSKMPRVVCMGDVNKDGYDDWVYHDGKGDSYWATMMFDNEKGVGKFTKDKTHYIQNFAYWDSEKTLREVPKNVLLIYY